MTNGEKYKTTEARTEALFVFCRDHNCSQCPARDGKNECRFVWLDLEAEEEKPLPCPFCGSECELNEIWDDELHRAIGHNVRCTICEYRSPEADKRDGSDAVTAHNQVARAVMAAKNAKK